MGSDNSFDWFLNLAARDEPLLRLFCFPHAGGGTHAYAKWAQALPEYLDVVAISPPGRGTRIREPPVEDLNAMATAIFDGVKLQADIPFAFFGHSLGSIIAYEVARRLASAGLPLPVLMFVSAHEPPTNAVDDPSWTSWTSWTRRGRPTSWMHELSDAEFTGAALERGFIPADAVSDAGLMAVLLPALRADLGIHERYSRAVGERAWAVLSYRGDGRPRRFFRVSGFAGEMVRGFQRGELRAADVRRRTFLPPN
jgi:medium-chain acyl-[acyl-carrier-protein] hydrolase